MDANGYTGIGVVSPAADQVGQPEILAAAKRGQIDTAVVRGRTQRPSRDCSTAPVSRALASSPRLRRTNCSSRTTAATGMAPCLSCSSARATTELLIPANLLAEDSVLSQSGTVLTEDVCEDVEVIGWLYQFYISERKDEVFAGFKKNKKAGADEIPCRHPALHPALDRPLPGRELRGPPVDAQPSRLSPR